MRGFGGMGIDSDLGGFTHVVFLCQLNFQVGVRKEVSAESTCMLHVVVFCKVVLFNTYVIHSYSLRRQRNHFK